MSRGDDLLSALQKAVGDKPVVLLAGAGDLVSEKLRELPAAISTWQAENRDFPLRAAGTLIGQAFRANLKAGEFYDELNRRGEDVVAKMRGEDVFAEEDEPFVREPFMPEPVQRTGQSAGRGTGPAKKTAGKKTTAKKTAAKKAAGKKAAGKKAAGKKTAAKKSTNAPT
jgi:hypothetical protein